MTRFALLALLLAAIAPRAHAQTSSRPLGGRVLDASREVVTAQSGFSFDLVRSNAANACLSEARGTVFLSARGSNDQMDVVLAGLPPRTTFTIFALQLPRAPFGMGWYVGDVTTDDLGNGRARFVGVFDEESFVVAPGSGAAPILHANDGGVNPPTAPIHLLHLGLWFEATADAVAAGCSATPTVFSGTHTAGIQVLNTSNFADGDGPIGQFGR
jgi:hypothetical protein